MTLQRPDRRDVGKGENYQDLVSGYVCSLAHQALNRRHLMQMKRGHIRPLTSRDIRMLTRWLVLLADAVLRDDYDDLATPDRSKPKRYQLDRDKLIRTMPSRAAWIIRTWDRTKVEGRRRGGRHSAASGTRKGPVPTYGVRDILRHYDLPPGERKARVMAESGMSATTYHRYLSEVPAALERIAARAAKASDPLAGLDFDAFLAGESIPLRATT